MKRALQSQLFRREVLRLRSEQCSRLGDIGAELISASPKMTAIYRMVKQVAHSPTTTVLIQGESGTGKELIARAIHLSSARRDQCFMEINCAALNESLLEAELFGYEKNAFTGAATAGKPGLFEVADGGTVFLDEIGEMTLPLQAKLLRVLQERRFKRVGGIEDVEVDVRIVASTNRDLETLVAAGQVPAGPVLPPARYAACCCRRCASGKRTSRRSRSITSSSSARGSARRSRASRRRRSKRWRSIAGRATCANCAT